MMPHHAHTVATGSAPVRSTTRRWRPFGRIAAMLGAGRGVRHPLAAELARPLSIPPTVLSQTDQWSRVTGVVEGAIRLAGSAASRQHDAAKKLDAAELALNRLLAEIIDLVPQACVGARRH